MHENQITSYRSYWIAAKTSSEKSQIDDMTLLRELFLLAFVAGACSQTILNAVQGLIPEKGNKPTLADTTGNLTRFIGGEMSLPPEPVYDLDLISISKKSPSD